MDYPPCNSLRLGKGGLSPWESPSRFFAGCGAVSSLSAKLNHPALLQPAEATIATLLGNHTGQRKEGRT